MDLLKVVEQEAIEHFGADKIGTKELRMALTKEEKEGLLAWLVNRYFEYTDNFGIFF